MRLNIRLPQPKRHAAGVVELSPLRLQRRKRYVAMKLLQHFF
jgi:hypothetical protein